MTTLSPTQRTLKHLSDQGYRCEIVERWIPQRGHPAGGVRRDFMKIIDLLAMQSGAGIIGVQSFGTAFSEHRRKILEEEVEALRFWLSLPETRFMLIGWRKLKAKRGGKRMLWTPRIEEIVLEDLP